MTLKRINLTQIDGIPPSGEEIILGNKDFPLKEIVVENVKTDAITFESGSTITPTKYKVVWSESERTYNFGLGNSVIGQSFQEIFFPLVINKTGSQILNGTPVAFAGHDEVSHRTKIIPFIADGSMSPSLYMGLTTETIENEQVGFVTHFGLVKDLDTSLWPPNTILFISDTDAGVLTNIEPESPSKSILVGVVVEQDNINGQILVRRTYFPDASHVSYDNNESLLVASNTQSAIDELNKTKAGVDMLTSNITLYSTTGATDIPGYFKLVASTHDPDYPTSPIDIIIDPVSGTSQYLCSLVAEPGLFVGNPGILNITTLGYIKKISGNKNQNANFYFETYKMDSGNTETYIGKSTNTADVTITGQYLQFNAYMLFDDGTFLITDRIVLKYYANYVTQIGGVFSFQFGGSFPVRTFIPVPVSVIPSNNASDILVDTTNFNQILGPTDDDVQHALETLDKHAHSEYVTLNTVQTVTNKTITVNDHSGVNPEVVNVLYGTDNPPTGTTATNGTLYVKYTP